MLPGLGASARALPNEDGLLDFTAPADGDYLLRLHYFTYTLGGPDYFYRLNIRGIHESSDRALKIMYATTIMVVVILVWCGVTLWSQGIACLHTDGPMVGDAAGEPLGRRPEARA